MSENKLRDGDGALTAYENKKNILEKTFDTVNDLKDFLELIGCDTQSLQDMDGTLFFNEELLEDGGIVPIAIKNEAGKIVFARHLRGDNELLSIIEKLREKRGLKNNRGFDEKIYEQQLFFQNMITGELEQQFGGNIYEALRKIIGKVSSGIVEYQGSRMEAFLKKIRPVMVKKIPIEFLRALDRFENEEIKNEFIQKIDFSKINISNELEASLFFSSISQLSDDLQVSIAEQLPIWSIEFIGPNEVEALDSLSSEARRRILTVCLKERGINLSNNESRDIFWGRIISSWKLECQMVFLQKIDINTFNPINKKQFRQLLEFKDSMLEVFLKTSFEDLNVSKDVFLDREILDIISTKKYELQEIITKSLKDGSVDKVSQENMIGIHHLSDYAKIIFFIKKVKKGVINKEFLEDDGNKTIMSLWDDTVLQIIQSVLGIK